MNNQQSITLGSLASILVFGLALASSSRVHAQARDNRAPDAPEAKLFDPDGNIVGIHYAGPTWESASGSKVVGIRLASAASASPNSIPQLLLRTPTPEGPGVLARTTYVQRVNTVGGVAPATPGSVAGEEVRVPYTAEYYFYRAQ